MKDRNFTSDPKFYVTCPVSPYYAYMRTYVRMYILNLHFFLINFSTVGEDYIGEVYNVTFDGSNIATVPVPSVDDDLVEGVEEFTAVIRVPNDTQREHLVTRGSPDTATVEINDNDSE